MRGGLTQTEDCGGHADLRGSGWGKWRGGWTSGLRLEGRRGGWELVGCDGSRPRWPNLERAVEELWSSRSVRDGRPWAVGWLSYDVCAELGGGLPARREPGRCLSGLLLLEPGRQEPLPFLRPGRAGSGARLESRPDDQSFREGVRRIKNLIAEGSVYQVNLCRRFTVDRWEGGLRRLFDAVAAGPGVPDYLSSFSWGGERPEELVCASMEMLVRKTGGRLETEPIKGTRPRGITPEEDRILFRELETDPKENAELAMIVDLERNDLGRVARTGSVVVEDSGRVKSWERIHHRVARVTASAADEVRWQDVVAAMAPGGSVTGCPKRAAMSVIADLEPRARGPFTGALGVIGGNGDLELALPIRTAWTSEERLEMAAGCGIVWESDPQAEEAESRLKIGKWLELVESIE